MSNNLPLPDGLKHLLEKRDTADRRATARRATEAAEPDEPRTNEKRSGLDRREGKRRLGE
ncbi:MAG: hypothetical protein P8J37_00625 [Fuerstiella sp.]|nr:hypothetical protein [Fuerstiella sp.]